MRDCSTYKQNTWRQTDCMLPEQNQRIRSMVTVDLRRSGSLSWHAKTHPTVSKMIKIPPYDPLGLIVQSVPRQRLTYFK